jgi:hypothetical protein
MKERMLALSAALAVATLGCGDKAPKQASEASPPQKSEPAPVQATPPALPGPLVRVTRKLAKKPDGAALLAIGRDELTLDGKTIVTLSDGALEPAEISDERETINKLESVLKAPAGEGEKPVTIYAHPGTPYETLLAVLMSAAYADFSAAYLLAEANDGSVGAVRSLLRRPPPPRTRVDDPVVPAPEIIVGVWEGQVSVYSLSGREGTVDEPNASFSTGVYEDQPDPLVQLQAVLLELVDRLWPAGKTRSELDLAAIVIFEPKTRFEEVMRWVAAIAHHANDRPLFPSIFFSPGYR